MLTKDQQRSNTLRRTLSGTFRVVRSDVQSAETMRTNCRSGMPGRWILRDCIMLLLCADARESIPPGEPMERSEPTVAKLRG